MTLSSFPYFMREPLKTPKSRLAAEPKAEFTLEVNEHFGSAA